MRQQISDANRKICKMNITVGVRQDTLSEEITILLTPNTAVDLSEKTPVSFLTGGASACAAVGHMPPTTGGNLCAKR